MSGPWPRPSRDLSHRTAYGTSAYSPRSPRKRRASLGPLDLLAQQLKPEPILFSRRELSLHFGEIGSRRREAAAVAGIEIRLGETLFQPTDVFIEGGNARGQLFQGVLLGGAQALARL